MFATCTGSGHRSAQSLFALPLAGSSLDPSLVSLNALVQLQAVAEGSRKPWARPSPSEGHLTLDVKCVSQVSLGLPSTEILRAYWR